MIKAVVCMVLFPVLAFAATERQYVDVHCVGQKEVVTPERTRIDCLTDTHAVEYDFGSKWAEAVGQSLHYAMYTGRRAGIALIVSDGEQRYVTRLKRTIVHYGLPIDIFVVPTDLVQ